MNRLENILGVWKTLGPEATITDLVDAFSKKYHIANDGPLFFVIKSTVDANKHLFDRQVSSMPVSLENDLSRIVTFEKFEMAYSKFLEQADKNATTQKSEGSKTPYGFDFEPRKNFINGGAFSQHFGQGAASKTPYMSWHVVSIYYAVKSERVILGIEQSRYSHLKDMQPIRTVAIGKQDRYVAVFYEIQKDNIDYHELYNKFMDVSQQVMELGLE